VRRLFAQRGERVASVGGTETTYQRDGADLPAWNERTLGRWAAGRGGAGRAGRRDAELGETAAARGAGNGGRGGGTGTTSGAGGERGRELGRERALRGRTACRRSTAGGWARADGGRSDAVGSGGERRRTRGVDDADGAARNVGGAWGQRRGVGVRLVTDLTGTVKNAVERTGGVTANATRRYARGVCYAGGGRRIWDGRGLRRRELLERPHRYDDGAAERKQGSYARNVKSVVGNADGEPRTGAEGGVAGTATRTAGGRGSDTATGRVTSGAWRVAADSILHTCEPCWGKKNSVGLREHGNVRG